MCNAYITRVRCKRYKQMQAYAHTHTRKLFSMHMCVCVAFVACLVAALRANPI